MTFLLAVILSCAGAMQALEDAYIADFGGKS
jgi:hypothetical protein